MNPAPPSAAEGRCPGTNFLAARVKGFSCQQPHTCTRPWGQRGTEERSASHLITYLPRHPLMSLGAHTCEMEVASLPRSLTVRQETKQVKKSVRKREEGKVTEPLAAACHLSKTLARDSKKYQRGLDCLPSRTPAPLVNSKHNLAPPCLGFSGNSLRTNPPASGTRPLPHPHSLACCTASNHPFRTGPGSSIPAPRHLHGLHLPALPSKAGGDRFSMPVSRALPTYRASSQVFKTQPWQETHGRSTWGGRGEGEGRETLRRDRLKLNVASGHGGSSTKIIILLLLSLVPCCRV